MDHLAAFQGEEDHPCLEEEEALASSEEVPLAVAHTFLEEAYLVLPAEFPSVMVLLQEVASPALVRNEESHLVAAFVVEVLQTARIVGGEGEEPGRV